MLPIASWYSAGVRGCPEPDFTNAANDRERRAELVRGIGGESAELIERGFQPRERVVDDGGQPSDLVVLIRHGQALVQPIGRDPPRFRREAVDRRERPPRQHVAADPREQDHQGQAEHQHREDLAELHAHAIL